jgi:hypothetical protein
MRDFALSTIRGSYAFTTHGTIFLPNGSTLLVDGIAKETYDGEGGVTQVDLEHAQLWDDKPRAGYFSVRLAIFDANIVALSRRFSACRIT